MTEPRAAHRHPFVAFLLDFRRQRMGMVGACIIGSMAFLALFADFLAPMPYNVGVLDNSESPPWTAYDLTAVDHGWLDADISGRYWLGTDLYGRDVLSRVIHGTRISISVGLISQGIALLIGVPLGALAGYLRGTVDSLVMWLINVFWSFPYLLLVLAFNLVLGDLMPGVMKIFVAIGLVAWVPVARLVRGQIISERENAYIEAGRAFGFGVTRIIVRHLLPNIFAPLLVVITLGFAQAIISEAALSFLGLGVEPPRPSWGAMLEESYDYLSASKGWWLYLCPGVAIAVSVLGFNLVGDGLRDALDPRLRGER